MIDGNTTLLAHIGYPTHSFKAPLIYNPYFAEAGINAVVVPMGCQVADYPALLKSLFALSNIGGALITMPHKVSTVALLDEASVAVKIAGACNAIKRDAGGRVARPLPSAGQGCRGDAAAGAAGRPRLGGDMAVRAPLCRSGRSAGRRHCDRLRRQAAKRDPG